jgi:hypothetical protein
MAAERQNPKLAMLKEDWEAYVKKHGRVPTWPPIMKHQNDPEQERDRNAQ